MAPEILLNENYQGHVIDLFALAIIMFILYSGHQPFHAANPKEDQVYNLIATCRADMFWNGHQTRKQADFYSE